MPRISAPLDFFGKTSALVADEQGHRLAPIDFPRSEDGCSPSRGFVDARSKRLNACNFQLRKKD